MEGMKAAGIFAAALGFGMWMQKRRRNSHFQKSIEANWKDIKNKLPDEWSDFAPRKKKEATRLVEAVHKATGESRRQIRHKIQGLTS